MSSTTDSLARPAADATTGTAPENVELSTWDWEGGHGAVPERTRPAPPAGLYAPPLTAVGPRHP